jgi:hypothetical protein
LRPVVGHQALQRQVELPDEHPVAPVGVRHGAHLAYDVEDLWPVVGVNPALTVPWRISRPPPRIRRVVPEPVVFDAEREHVDPEAVDPLSSQKRITPHMASLTSGLCQFRYGCFTSKV